MRRIIGLDVGGAYSTAFLLEGDRPKDLRSFVQSKHFTPFRVDHCEEDLTALIEMKADLIVFEPTGFHYEALLINWCDRHNQPWCRVVGRRISAYRQSLGLPKTDGRDALALACYGVDYADDPSAFTQPCELIDLRHLWIQRDTLQRNRISLVNRLRQTMKHEFPEAADLAMDRKWLDPCPALIRWMADDETLASHFANRYRNMHSAGTWKTKSNRKLTTTNGTIGTGLSAYSRLLARQILESDQMCRDHEQKMIDFLQHPKFAAYNTAFDSLDFSPLVRTIWLTRVYPFERFLGEDGKPIKTKRISHRGKPVTCHVSLGRFKAAVGAGLEPKSSGISQEWMPMGDKLCRRSFCMWASLRLETYKIEAKTPELKKLIEKHQELKNRKTNKYQRLSNLQGYAARLLFRKLCEVLS